MSHSIKDPIENLLRSTRGEGPDCLAIDRLADLAAGDSPTDRETTHLDTCVRCSAELDLARSFDAPIKEESSERVEQIAKALEAQHRAVRPATVIPFAPRMQPRRSKTIARWAAAAMVVMASGFVTWQMRSTPPLLPDRPDIDITRGSVLELDLPDHSDPLGWSRVSWQSHPEAQAYRVEIQRIDGETVWTSQTLGTDAVLPPEIRNEIAPGVTLRWRVEALGLDGTLEAVSGWLEVKRPTVPPPDPS